MTNLVADGHRDVPELRRRLEAVLEEDVAFEGVEVDRPFPEIGRRVDGGVEVDVADHRPRIPVDAKERVFQIFRQLDPHGAGRDGSGIGLALCRKIVERHGGTIRVESGPGVVATFRFTLSRDPEATL